MPLPNTLDSYGPELDIWDKALADPTGVRVCYATKDLALIARNRLHQSRALDREQSKRVYEPNNRLYGKSPYDILICRNPREDDAGEWWIYIERHGMEIKAVESLSEVRT